MNMPQYIYKFLPNTAYSLKSLSKNEVWFSYIENLNDPFEGSIKFESIEKANLAEWYVSFLIRMKKISKDDRSTYIETLLTNAQAYDGLLETIRRIESNYNSDVSKSVSVYSCSFDGEIACQDNVLMWAHYANQFNGFCIKYDLEIFLESLKNLNNKKISIEKVEYVSDISSADLFKHVDSAAYGRENDDDAFSKALKQKGKMWAYENEIRFLSSNDGGFKIDPHAVLEVYHGSRMQKEYQQELRKALKENYSLVKFFRADPYNYKVNIVGPL